MNNQYSKAHKQLESGYALIAVIIILIASLLAVHGTLSLVAANARTVHEVELRAQDYYESEQALNHVVQWMRQNSQKIASPFRRDEFYTNFTKATPSYGDNDTSNYKVLTKVKLAGTNNSAILVNGDTLATPAFPPTTDIVTFSVFPAQSNFSRANFGNAQVRLTLIDVIADIPGKDYGPPPNPAPETDFYPIYQVDAMTETTSGAHIYGTVTTSLTHLFNWGIHGEDYLSVQKECDSYNTTTYSSTTKRAHCPASSYTSVDLGTIYGTVKTNGAIDGGKVCADFQSGCPNKGYTCSGADCGVPQIPRYHDWNYYCPDSLGNVTVAAKNSPTGYALLIQNDQPKQRCWAKVSVGNNSILVLKSTKYPYFIRELDLKNNSQFKIDPDVPGKTVTLYVLTITGNKINAKQIINDQSPTTFHMYYLGTNELTVNGDADMRVAMLAPNAAVHLLGNEDYFGALIAKSLTIQGSGTIHYDEALGASGETSDTQYRLRDLVQYYR